MLYSDKPSVAFPDIPTTRDQGYSADFQLLWWWFVPADTPDDEYAALADLIAKVMADPAAQKDITDHGITVATYAGPAEATQQVSDQLESIGKTLREIGVIK